MYRELITLSAPLEHYASALAREPGFVWLDANLADAAWGEHSYLSADPVEVVCASHDRGEIIAALERLSKVDQQSESALPRWMGFISYDAHFALDGTTSRHADNTSAPSLWFARYDALLVYHKPTGRAELVGIDENAARALRAKLDAASSKQSYLMGPYQVDDASQHQDAIHTALALIRQGDLYQVNLARRWRAQFEGSAIALYQAMRERSPVPLGAFINTGPLQILSRSMELFLDWQQRSRMLRTAPIKGTHPEHNVAIELDPKEHAEHSMVIDLMRNDLSRVAQAGTVVIEERMRTQPYAGLSHLVSTIACRTRSGVNFTDLIQATFPPGSVTGTPKPSALRAIDTLEPHARGIYTGCIGYVAFDGSVRLNVAIRTAVIQKNELSYFAGGGIVAASDAAKEISETELKARVLTERGSD